MQRLKSAIHFVIISEHVWDRHPESAAQKLGVQISQWFPVFYINPPTANIRYYAQKNRKYKYAENITLYTPFLFFSLVLAPCSTNIGWRLPCSCSKRLHKSVQEAIALLPTNKLIVVNNSSWINTKELTKRIHIRVTVFLLNSVFSWKQDQKKCWEPFVAANCRTSDLVVTSNTFLKNYASHYTSEAYNIEEGAQQLSYPIEKQPILGGLSPNSSPPVIGYWGTLDPHFIDMPLLLRICQRTPDYQYLLITQDKPSEDNALLESLNNVKIRHLQTPKEGVHYIQQTDIGIIPQAINYCTLVRSLNQMFSFFAYGKPVVAKRTINTIPYSAYMHLAYGDNEFIEAINSAIHANSITEQMERINLAHRMNWEQISLNLFGIIYQTTGEVLLPPTSAHPK